ncbi:putative coatomer subunit beta', partial [Toxocara canis]
VNRVVSLWKEKSSSGVFDGQKNMGESLADPHSYENLFPGFSKSLKAEQFLRQLSRLPIPANARAPTNAQRNILEEMAEAEKSGALMFREDGSAVLGSGMDSRGRSSAVPTSANSPLDAFVKQHAAEMHTNKEHRPALESIVNGAHQWPSTTSGPDTTTHEVKRATSPKMHKRSISPPAERNSTPPTYEGATADRSGSSHEQGILPKASPTPVLSHSFPSLVSFSISLKTA